MAKISIPQVKIVNAQTGEEIIRDANAEELAQFEKGAIEFEASEKAKVAKELARQAVLDKLGLTADDLKTLLG